MLWMNKELEYTLFLEYYIIEEGAVLHLSMKSRSNLAKLFEEISKFYHRILPRHLSA